MYSSSGDGGAAASEAATQAQLQQGTDAVNSAFSDFTHSFYQQAAQDYTNYATPQVDQQYQNTKNNLTYALARNGLTSSGAGVQRNNSLNQQLNTNLSDIANTAQDQSNTLETNVNNQKNQLMSQVEAGAQPGQIATQAAAATSSLRAPTALPAVGNMFSDWSNTYLANMAANTYNPSNANLLNMFGGNGGYTGTSGSSAIVN